MYKLELQVHEVNALIILLAKSRDDYTLNVILNKLEYTAKMGPLEDALELPLILPPFKGSDEIQQRTDKMMEISAALLEQNSTRFERIFAAALTGLCARLGERQIVDIDDINEDAIQISTTAMQRLKDL